MQSGCFHFFRSMPPDSRDYVTFFRDSKNQALQQQIVFILLSLALFIVAGCDTRAKPVPVLRIGHAPHDHHSPLYIAAMNPEYFKENGGIYLRETSFREHYQLISHDRILAEVEIFRSKAGGKEIIRRLTEDQFDFTFGGVPPILHFIDQGAPIRILAPSNAEGAGLVVANALPVSTWNDFVILARSRSAPLRIGYKIDMSVQNLIFEQALREEGLSFSRDIEDSTAMIIMVNLHGPENMIPALEDRLIEGFIVNQPFPALAEYQGAGKQIASLYDLPPYGRWHGSPCCAVAGTSSFVTSHPEASEAMITLLLRANRFITDNPDQAAQQIATWLDLPAEVEKRALQTIKFTTDFDASWNKGVLFWLENFHQSGGLTGKLKEITLPDELEPLLYDQDLYQRARNNL